MATQGLLQEIGGQIAATAPLGESMALEVIHHPTGEGDIDALRTGRIRHRSRAGSRDLPLNPLLQLLNQILKKRHDSVQISSQYQHNVVQDKVA